MAKPVKNKFADSCPMDISDDDILEAMKEIDGYLDITPGDFKEIYGFAYRHAIERLTRLVKARDVMRRNVVFVHKDTPLKDVADLMCRHNISGVPVIDDKQTVVGVISEKDFLFHMGEKDTRSFMGVVAQCLKGPGCVAVSIRRQLAEDIMTSPAVTAGEETPVSEISTLLTEKNINRLLVTDRNDRLMGIVTKTDLVQSFCSTA